LHPFDAELYSNLFEREFDLVCFILRQKGLRGEDIDEVAADVFEKFYSAWQRTSLDNPRGYLHQVARTMAIDARRRFSVRPQGHADPIQDNDHVDTGVEMRFFDDQMNKKLRSTVTAFEVEDGQRFISMRYFEDRSVAEVCEFHGWPMGSYGGKEKRILSAFQDYAKRLWKLA